MLQMNLEGIPIGKRKELLYQILSSQSDNSPYYYHYRIGATKRHSLGVKNNYSFLTNRIRHSEETSRNTIKTHARVCRLSSGSRDVTLRRNNIDKMLRALHVACGEGSERRRGEGRLYGSPSWRDKL